VERLTQLETERQKVEEEARRRIAYDEARELRDVAAAQIRTRYPGIQRELMEIIAKIAEAMVAVNMVNQELPEGADRLHHAEGVVFGYPHNNRERPVGYRPPQIAEMLIPDMNNWSVPAWPPHWLAGGDRPSEQSIETNLARLRDSRRGRK
jgi:hypothetical protein